ncbi:MAG: HXXEE domain-containing protein [Lachnospiraceae bacterium]|nr:HXXEE domain-containing protein [Lachnospiraceae bacterium]
MLKKYNLEIMTVLFFGMITSCAVFGSQLRLIQRIMLEYMFLFTLHEWEETRFPGGFADLMVKFFGVKADADQIAKAHIPVAVLLLVITFVPFFTQNPILSLVPIYLGLFETFIHLAGIKIHKMDKPYTPGMVTGILLGITSVIVLVTYSREQLLSGIGYVWGIPLMILCFAAMQRTVLAIYGLGYKFVIANVKKKLRRTV